MRELIWPPTEPSIRMKRRTSVPAILALFLPSLAMAQAPVRAAPAGEWVLWTPSIEWAAAPPAAAAEEDRGAVTFLGAAAGFGVATLGAASLLTGYALSGGPPEHFTPVFVVGAAATTAVGAHLGNRRRGDVWTTMAATGLTLAASVIALDALGDGGNAAPAGLLVTASVLTILAATGTELSTMNSAGEER